MKVQNIRIKNLIDNKMGYRGEIMLTFRPQFEGSGKVYDIGDKICQLIIMPYPIIEPVEATELSETERGENGHGSSGN